MRELEAVETAAFRDFYSVPSGEVRELGGGAVCLVARSTPVQWLNRVAGLGVERPATDADLDEVAGVFGDVPHSVAVSPAAEGLDELLQARGYRPGYAWMKFRRGVEPLAGRGTDLEIDEARDGAAFAHVVAEAYGFPAAIAQMVAGVPGRPGWHCLLALDGGEPVGAGALFENGNVGWLGFAGTLPQARGRGAQGAILAARIDLARAAGCTLLTTETGVREPGKADNSYRNILRAGFVEAGERPNYVS